jgi:hypothetical protein
MPVEDIGTLSLQECRLVEGYFISHLLTKGKITQCKNLNITSNIDRDCAVVSFQNLRQFFHLIVAALGHHKFSSRIFTWSTKTEKGNDACLSGGRQDKHGLKLYCFLAKQELLDHSLQNQPFL